MPVQEIPSMILNLSLQLLQVKFMSKFSTIEVP